MTASRASQTKVPPAPHVAVGLQGDRHVRALVASGEPAVSVQVADVLRRGGHEVVSCSEGREVLALAGTGVVELVLLDLVLPDLPGSEVCRRLRASPATRAIPVMVVTSRKDETDRVAAFEVGADDFVGVPFSARELMLRVRVLLRPRPEEERAAILRVGALEVDVGAHRASVDGREVVLSVREFRLLLALMRQCGRVLPRKELLDVVWDGADVGVRSVDAYVTRLRRKLGPARSQIETVSNVGYRLRGAAR